MHSYFLPIAHYGPSSVLVLTSSRARIDRSLTTVSAFAARLRRTGFGVVELDRRGRTLRLTGPQRTLVDGFAAPTLSASGTAALITALFGFGFLAVRRRSRV